MHFVQCAMHPNNFIIASGHFIFVTQYADTNVLILCLSTIHNL